MDKTLTCKDTSIYQWPEKSAEARDRRVRGYRLVATDFSEADRKKFYAKFTKQEPEKCWDWGSSAENRYGKIKTHAGKHICVHRISYAINFGEVPAGLSVCHKCDRPKCVNPNHLFLGTMEDNVRDRTQKGRTSKARGENKHTSTLTEKQVIEIRENFHKMTEESLAKKFNVSRATISRATIWRAAVGVCWSHIPNPVRSLTRNEVYMKAARGRNSKGQFLPRPIPAIA